MAAELGKELGVDVDLYRQFVCPADRLLAADRFDIAMFAIGVTPSRAEKLRFTRLHLASDFYAIASKTNRRIKGLNDIDRPGRWSRWSRNGARAGDERKARRRATAGSRHAVRARTGSPIGTRRRLHHRLPL